ncbi:MAG: dihydrofolate reductase, partial [Muribaculaceae bacterium]
MSIINKTAAFLLAASMSSTMIAKQDDFKYVVDRFADIEVLRYQVPDFESLTLNQKLYVYYLTEAALYGRDIMWDQNGKYNLALRQLLEDTYTASNGDKTDPQFVAFEK